MWKRAPVKIFDPREGQGYQISVMGEIFSSLAHNVMVIEAQPRFNTLGVSVFGQTLEMCQHRELMTFLLENTSRQGFVTWVPWTPEPIGVRDLLRALPGYDEADGSVMSTFGISRQGLDDVCRIRSEAKYEGEWSIGGAREQLVSPRQIGIKGAMLWNLGHLLRQIDRIGCLFSKEAGQVLLVSQLFDGVDRVYELLNDGSGSDEETAY